MYIVGEGGGLKKYSNCSLSFSLFPQAFVLLIFGILVGNFSLALVIFNWINKWQIFSYFQRIIYFHIQKRNILEGTLDESSLYGLTFLQRLTRKEQQKGK